MSQFRPIIKPQLSNNKWNPVGNLVIALQAAQLKDVQVSLEHQNNLQGKKLVEHELNYITKGGFFSESAIRFLRCPNLKKKIFQKTILTPSFPVNNSILLE